MYNQLTSQQRSQIFALLQRKTQRKEIALIVGCSQSTLSRELRRNSTAKGHYLWEKAHAKAMDRRKRTTSNRKLDSILVWRIKQMITDHLWSPEQIRGVLGKEGISVSIQSIYNIINADVSGELRKHRRHPNFRRRPKAERKPTKATNIPDRTSIHERPSEADGHRFGDFEMDLTVDSYGHAILVLLERLTGFVMMERLPYGKRAKPLSEAVVRLLFAYRKCVRTITTDNGSEFTAHSDITAGLRMKGRDDVIVYFADAYCSWQKGAVENVNKLIRQYIPKKSNFNSFSDRFIMDVAKKINLRPRKKLRFSNPKTEFFKQIDNFALAS
ncbi:MULTISPECIES: IS30 family transposase [Bacteroides]|jgi:IS30 family transposase|uniref:IS30 family transposase n=1 Tax=Bacteroides TaxID=816 RepID=UPI00117C4BBA|nr:MULTISPECIES: IS30 family transposase [Bacteroides]